MNSEYEEIGSSDSSIRTYSAKEAVRLAKERVRRNDMIVTQLLQKSSLTEFESGPTKDMVHLTPGELSRPNTSESLRDRQSENDDKSIGETENDSYRIKTSSTIISFFRDLFD